MNETFSYRCKNEIIRSLADKNPCCLTSFLYGAVCFAKQLSRERIVISSKNPLCIDAVAQAFIRSGVNESSIIVSHKQNESVLDIQNETTVDRILSDYGYSGEEATLRLHADIMLCDDCAHSFLAGCFLLGGTVTDPAVNYHLELLTPKNLFALDLRDYLYSNGFPPLITKRYYSKVIYFKDSSLIEDLLVAFGAVSCSMELMNAKIYKGLRNDVNRRINCDSANLDKAVAASLAVRKDIEYIFDTGNERLLGEELLKVAKLRLENPEYALSELASELSLSKPGLHHRLQRIKEIAARIRENNDNT